MQTEEEKEAKQKEKSDIRPLLARVKQRETEQSAAYRKQSYDYFLTAIEAEEWVDLTWFQEGVCVATCFLSYTDLSCVYLGVSHV